MIRILKTGHNCRGMHKVTGAGPLIDGREYYRAFHNAAAKARKYILMAAWQFDGNERLLRARDADGLGEEGTLVQHKRCA